MTTPSNKPSVLQTWGLAIAGLLVLAVFLVIWGAGIAGDAINGAAVEPNPFGYVFELILGKRPWPGFWSTAILIAFAVLLLGLGVLVVLLARRRARRSKTAQRLEVAANQLGRAADLTELSPKVVAASAARLRPQTQIDPRRAEQHGRYIGHTVADGMEFRADFESLGVHIWGPRRGKTTSLTVPQVVEAPGAVIATSNKRDLHDATRGPREARGSVFVFDPQQVVGEPPRFWYDLLGRVTDFSSATLVAGHFVTGTRDPEAKTDSYFDGSAEKLLAAYLLAARHGGKTLTDVYRWIADDRDKTPIRLLADHGEELVSITVNSIIQAPEKQRKGVFDTCLTLLQCLLNRGVLDWVTPPSDGRPEFNPADFVASTDTLYLLSMEQKGSAGPLVAALTEHVCHEAVQRATRQAGGRLDPPLLAQLDEAANVCRWRDLPNLYSHFGSRGVLIDVILQSWSQGQEAWGDLGMKKMWGAANIRTYGGGGIDGAFLRDLAAIAGRADSEKLSMSVDHQGRRTYSSSTQLEDIMPVDLLAAIPRGRALVLASGAPAFLVEPRQWREGPHAAEIAASIAKYDPGAVTTP